MTTEFMPYKVQCKHDAIVDVVNIVQHPKNPNKHPPAQLDLISRVILSNGWRSPIVISKLTGYVIKGHGRYQAAVKAGWTHVPVEYQDYANVMEELADLVADNKISELSFLSTDDISSIIQDVKLELPDYDFESTFGFSNVEINSIVEQWEPVKEKIDNIQANSDEAPCKISIRCSQDQEEKIKKEVTEMLAFFPGAAII